jgi:hypothetical protein
VTVKDFASVLFSTESALLVMATLLLLVSHLFHVRLRQYRQWQAHCTHIERQIRDLDRLIHRHWVLYLTYLHRGEDKKAMAELDFIEKWEADVQGLEIELRYWTK